MIVCVRVVCIIQDQEPVISRLEVGKCSSHSVYIFRAIQDICNLDEVFLGSILCADIDPKYSPETSQLVAFPIAFTGSIKDLLLTNFVCNLKTYLTLSLSAHSSDYKTSLLLTLLGANYG